MEDPEAALLIGRLAEWFEETTKSKYGGVQLPGNPGRRPKKQISAVPGVGGSSVSQMCGAAPGKRRDSMKGAGLIPAAGGSRRMEGFKPSAANKWISHDRYDGSEHE